MIRTERSMLLDAIVLYSSTKQLLPEKDREMWETWKNLALELLYGGSTRQCEIRMGLFDRFYIFHPTMNLAWSGSQWVTVTHEGLPTEGVQVCNFGTEQEAIEYCREYELETL